MLIRHSKYSVILSKSKNTLLKTVFGDFAHCDSIVLLTCIKRVFIIDLAPWIKSCIRHMELLKSSAKNDEHSPTIALITS